MHDCAEANGQEPEDKDSFGLWVGQCQACECIAPVDDLSLCQDCAAKLERDFIRKREWEYSAMAFGCPDDQREALRDEIVKRYGESLELMAGAEP
jgi:hypothetical protein